MSRFLNVPLLRKKYEYLGHIISGKDMRTYPKKVVVMVEWPRPMIVKELREFLGLTGYYQKFIQLTD